VRERQGETGTDVWNCVLKLSLRFARPIIYKVYITRVCICSFFYGHVLLLISFYETFRFYFMGVPVTLFDGQFVSRFSVAIGPSSQATN